MFVFFCFMSIFFNTFCCKHASYSPYETLYALNIHNIYTRNEHQPMDYSTAHFPHHSITWASGEPLEQLPDLSCARVQHCFVWGVPYSLHSAFSPYTHPFQTAHTLWAVHQVAVGSSSVGRRRTWGWEAPRLPAVPLAWQRKMLTASHQFTLCCLLEEYCTFMDDILQLIRR